MADVADSLDATRGTSADSSAAAINDGSQSSSGNDALCLGHPGDDGHGQGRHSHGHDGDGDGQGYSHGRDGHGQGYSHDDGGHDGQGHSYGHESHGPDGQGHSYGHEIHGHDGQGHSYGHESDGHDGQGHSYGHESLGHQGHPSLGQGHVYGHESQGQDHSHVHDGQGHGDSYGDQNLNLIPAPLPSRPSLWYEEEIDENLRWCFGLISILHTGVSKYQEIALLDTQSFGKVLTLDRKMQSAEMDEWVYHECLVHPALLLHNSPKSVFILGGGEGSTAREALRHFSLEKVVMCDIDEEVVKFCSTHLINNREAFENPRLELVINDAKAELKSRDELFDVIVGDLADPLEWGPCYQLYSKDFYQNILKPKLNLGGIFVTQAGPAGILSHKEVFTSIYNTLKHAFAYVVAYTAHIPSYADTWGWVMASDQPLGQVSTFDLEIDSKIKQRIKGDLRYLDGPTLHASTVLNKTIRISLENENHVYTEGSARFLYGHGRKANAH